MCSRHRNNLISNAPFDVTVEILRPNGMQTSFTLLVYCNDKGSILEQKAIAIITLVNILSCVTDNWIKTYSCDLTHHAAYFINKKAVDSLDSLAKGLFPDRKMDNRGEWIIQGRNTSFDRSVAIGVSVYKTVYKITAQKKGKITSWLFRSKLLPKGGFWRQSAGYQGEKGSRRKLVGKDWCFWKEVVKETERSVNLVAIHSPFTLLPAEE